MLILYLQLYCLDVKAKASVASLLFYNSCPFLAVQLHAELSQLNLNLPARVCVPLFSSQHQVLRIPSSESVVLNSKSKVHKRSCGVSFYPYSVESYCLQKILPLKSG